MDPETRLLQAQLHREVLDTISREIGRSRRWAAGIALALLLLALATWSAHANRPEARQAIPSQIVVGNDSATATASLALHVHCYHATQHFASGSASLEHAEPSDVPLQFVDSDRKPLVHENVPSSSHGALFVVYGGHDTRRMRANPRFDSNFDLAAHRGASVKRWLAGAMGLAASEASARIVVVPSSETPSMCEETDMAADSDVALRTPKIQVIEFVAKEE